MYGEKLIDLNRLDKAKITLYKKLPNLLELLDEWILNPDKELLRDLIDLSLKMKRLSPLPKKLYRGFDPTSSYQNTLGLSEKGFLWNKVKDYGTGYKFEYISNTDPLSFTSDYSIAKDFGTTVVELLHSKLSNYINIDNELAYLICLKRNITPVTQHEVILLPPYSLNLLVVEK